MSAQPTPEDQDWVARQRTRGRNSRQVRPVSDPATGQNDVVDLVRNQRRLQETLDSMVDDVERLAEAVVAHARALVAWEVHRGRQTKKLDDAGTRSNEDLRLAYALAYHDAETSAAGRDLYRAYIEAKTMVEALQVALKAKSAIASGSQTLLNHGSAATGLT